MVRLPPSSWSMIRLTVRRLLEGLMALTLVVIVVFALGRAIGNPADILLPNTATPEQRASLSAELGLDRSLIDQFGNYVLQLSTGQFGKSAYSGVPVATLIFQRLPNSLELTSAATLVGIVLAVPLGVLAATRRNTPWDALARTFALAGQAAPPFWLGLVLVLVFSVQLRLLPAAGAGTMQQLALPAMTLGWFIGAGILRLL